MLGYAYQLEVPQKAEDDSSQVVLGRYPRPCLSVRPISGVGRWKMRTEPLTFRKV